MDLSASGGDLESPLEASVYDTLRSWGYDVTPQVGTAGYRIDLGVRHPQQPGRFMLGVECDGAAYHSSAVARDRDRLRQEILEGLGWRLHRIWGPAWYRDRQGQEDKLRTALEHASAGQDPSSNGSRSAPERRRTESAQLDGAPPWAVPYVVCVPQMTGSYGHPADAGEFQRLRSVVHAIVKAEAPIHTSLLARRVTQVWRCNLTGRVREAVDGAAASLAEAHYCRLDGDVVRIPGTPADQQVRVPDQGDDRTRRDVADIPPHELRNAVRLLLSDARSADVDELLTGVRQLFGFDRTSARMYAALEQALITLIDEGVAERGPDGRLRPIS